MLLIFWTLNFFFLDHFTEKLNFSPPVVKHSVSNEFFFSVISNIPLLLAVQKILNALSWNVYNLAHNIFSPDMKLQETISEDMKLLNLWELTYFLKQKSFLVLCFEWCMTAPQCKPLSMEQAILSDMNHLFNAKVTGSLVMRTAKHAVGCNVIAFCFVCNGMTLYPPISVWPSVRHNFLNFVLAKYAVISFENFICATLGGRVGEKMRIISPFIHPELLNACNNCWIDQHTVWLFSRRFKDFKYSS